jgi:hypothetical protein
MVSSTRMRAESSLFAPISPLSPVKISDRFPSRRDLDLHVRVSAFACFSWTSFLKIMREVLRKRRDERLNLII